MSINTETSHEPAQPLPQVASGGDKEVVKEKKASDVPPKPLSLPRVVKLKRKACVSPFTISFPSL